MIRNVSKKIVAFNFAHFWHSWYFSTSYSVLPLNVTLNILTRKTMIKVGIRDVFVAAVPIVWHSLSNANWSPWIAHFWWRGLPPEVKLKLTDKHMILHWLGGGTMTHFIGMVIPWEGLCLSSPNTMDVSSLSSLLYRYFHGDASDNMVEKYSMLDTAWRFTHKKSF